MKERPILMHGRSVRALLDGTKTQTRRPAKPSAYQRRYVRERWGNTTPTPTQWNDMAGEAARANLRLGESSCCPFGVPGDRLWVRETHRRWLPDCETWSCRYRADDTVRDDLAQWDEGPQFLTPEDAGLVFEPLTWKPSIHMPRWASRLTLEIVSVRVERVQAISREDVRAEGVSIMDDDSDMMAMAMFFDRWDEIHADSNFSVFRNPWVWVLTFRRVTP